MQLTLGSEHCSGLWMWSCKKAASTDMATGCSGTVSCAQPGSHIAALSNCVAQAGKTSSFPPGKANSLVCSKCPLCTLVPKSIAILAMMVFEKMCSCQAMDRYPFLSIYSRTGTRDCHSVEQGCSLPHCSSAREVYGHLAQLTSEKSSSLVQSKPFNCLTAPLVSA